MTLVGAPPAPAPAPVLPTGNSEGARSRWCQSCGLGCYAMLCYALPCCGYAIYAMR
ncbi:hypothetical protein BD289DRAFT_444736 [Coniella lustricola]|uniref:Uncharacterized protein n=1 Tax=Coniella lustricola TaxID=2025994 RepID=A0A2T2ZVM0_9PEZI|nr:hypothetical protein BD289DRAFT_444736 [Coniella lustricola]